MVKQLLDGKWAALHVMLTAALSAALRAARYEPAQSTSWALPEIEGEDFGVWAIIGTVATLVFGQCVMEASEDVWALLRCCKAPFSLKAIGSCFQAVTPVSPMQAQSALNDLEAGADIETIIERILAGVPFTDGMEVLPGTAATEDTGQAVGAWGWDGPSIRRQGMLSISHESLDSLAYSASTSSKLSEGALHPTSAWLPTDQTWGSCPSTGTDDTLLCEEAGGLAREGASGGSAGGLLKLDVAVQTIVSWARASCTCSNCSRPPQLPGGPGPRGIFDGIWQLSEQSPTPSGASSQPFLCIVGQCVMDLEGNRARLKQRGQTTFLHGATMTVEANTLRLIQKSGRYLTFHRIRTQCDRPAILCRSWRRHHHSACSSCRRGCGQQHWQGRQPSNIDEARFAARWQRQLARRQCPKAHAAALLCGTGAADGPASTSCRVRP